jgi:hypothetical protein
MRHLPNNTRLMACSCATALAQQRIYSMDSGPASQLPRLRQAYIIPPPLLHRRNIPHSQSMDVASVMSSPQLVGLHKGIDIKLPKLAQRI